MSPKVLYLIPTPLSDTARVGMLSPFTDSILQSSTNFFVENLRTARRFISSLKLGITIDELTFFELTKDTEPEEIKKMVAQLSADVSQLCLMSEAGCPGIADPGSRLVALAHTLNWQVVPVPGPSSLLLALMGSGFNGQQFCFHGYLPIKQDDRIKAIKRLEEETLKKGSTQLFIETPYRNLSILQDLVSFLHPETHLCIAANLTSEEEMISTKKVKDWKNNIPNIHKIPTIFLIGSIK